MSALDFLLPRDSQPQEVVEVDWSNPITRGLVFCVPGLPGQYDDIAGGKKATVVGSLGPTATKDGRYPLFSGSQHLTYPNFGAELSNTMPATIAWLQTPISLSAYGTIGNLAISGTAAGFIIAYQHPTATSYRFATGIAGTSAIDWDSTGDIGGLTNGQTDRFILRTSTNLFTTTKSDFSLFKNSRKFIGSVASNFGGPVYQNRFGTNGAGSDWWEGALGLFAIWNRALTDEEALSYNANPWQLFAPQSIWGPVSAGGGGTEVGLSIETDASLALSAIHILAVGQATETDTALAPPGALVAPVGRADETDAALALGAVHAAAFGVAVETDEAFELTGPAAGAVGRADETDAALALDAVHSAPFGVAEETDAALVPESPTTEEVASQGGRRRKPKRLSYQEYDVPLPPEVLTSTIPQDTPPTGIEPAPIPSKLKPASKLATRPARVKAPKVEAPAPEPVATPEPQAAAPVAAPVVVTAATPVPAVPAPVRPLMLSDILAAESMTNDEILRAMKVLARLHIGPQLRRDPPKKLIRG